MGDTPHIYGLESSGRAGCVHHKASVDIIAIKFKCCGRYFPCYACHEALADHPVERWKRSEWNQQAILCRACGREMTIEVYMSSASQCPHCLASFNPRCEKHWHFYFHM